MQARDIAAPTRTLTVKKIAAYAVIGLLSAYVAGCSMMGMDASQNNTMGNSTSSNMTH